MSYAVKWTLAARDQLASIWMDHGNRSAVTEAANQLDAALAADAPNLGESRDGLARIAFAKPLVIQFVVLADVRGF
ncbi:MAG: hypothetical protein KDA44_03210 [Planctomycetales bacterium]|nr:hypothetical protein [Planctomycetales bacterium]